MIAEENQEAIQEKICQALEHKAAAWGQQAVYAVVSEDMAKSVGIYERRGYSEQMRSFGAFIGLGLKLSAIAYAQAHHGRAIATSFAAENQASVNLNLKLGFVCEPSWITCHKFLSAQHINPL